MNKTLDSYFWYEVPEYLSEEWFRLHRHLSDGALLAAAVKHRIMASAWATSCIRLGDEHVTRRFL